MKAIVFFPRTGATRLFHSYNLAQEWYPNKSPITRPSQFNGKRDYTNMWFWAKSRNFDLTDYPHPENNPLIMERSELDDLTWRLAWECGNLVERPPKLNTAKPLKAGFVINLDHPPLPLSVQKQARSIAARLKEEQHDFYTTEEMKRFMASFKTLKAIRTKQDPWRIFRYYRKTLIEHNVIKEQ